MMTTWTQGSEEPIWTPADIARAVERAREGVAVVQDPASGRRGIGFGGSVSSTQRNGVPQLESVSTLAPVFPEWLGDRSFNEVHGVRFPYVAGAMANGIASVDLVIAMARSGMLGFYGAAGLGLPRIGREIEQLRGALGNDVAWGANLIHAPNEPELEAATAELFVERGVLRVSASAYMALTAPIVHYSLAGLRVGPKGEIQRDHHVFAKISRPETASKFMRPAPESLVRRLVEQGKITEQQARLAELVAVAEDITVEADSGGHTDNQPLGALFPVIAHLRDQIVAEQGYSRPIRVGAAGGIGTPSSVASAFGLGAAYVLTGSVNQAAVESGLSERGREMLAKTTFGDVMMAPAADMFELGVKLQVLKRGTMFGVRAERLWHVYQAYAGFDQIPADERATLEKQTLGRPIDDIWADCEAFWGERDPAQLERAATDARHKMALVFRWYLGMSSRWAIAGEGDRALDFQIWCGPAMAAFNAWAKGTFLEDPAERSVVQIALNLLEGAAVVTRAHQLRAAGVPVPAAAFSFVPRRLTL